MAKFRVELHRRIHRPGERAVNPFLAPMPAPGQRSMMNVRSWEFEAKDEAEVRRLLEIAYERKYANVVGYTLRSIERLT